jgi:Helix-turn-helix domain
VNARRYSTRAHVATEGAGTCSRCLPTSRPSNYPCPTIQPEELSHSSALESVAHLPLVSSGWLTTEQVARLLNVDPSTVRRWRTQEPLQGPPFVRLSERVTMYSARDLEDWLSKLRIIPTAA